MLTVDWRSPADYQHANSIPDAGFAWEYLRRDERYQREFYIMNRREVPSASALNAFSQRWGLRFHT